MFHRYNEDLERMRALSMLGAYLVSTAVSPMQKAFVNIKEPLATGVYVYPNSYMHPSMQVNL